MAVAEILPGRRIEARGIAFITDPWMHHMARVTGSELSDRGGVTHIEHPLGITVRLSPYRDPNRTMTVSIPDIGEVEFGDGFVIFYDNSIEIMRNDDEFDGKRIEEVLKLSKKEYTFGRREALGLHWAV